MRLLVDDKSEVLQIMAWCQQNPAQYYAAYWWAVLVTSHDSLTHLGQDKMATIFQTIFSNTELLRQWINSLAAGRCGHEFIHVIFKYVGDWYLHRAPKWMPQNVIHD